MGGLYSSQKSNEHINYVKSSFELHKNSIEGLVQVFETQRNQYDIFLNSADTQVPNEDNGSFENGTDVDSVDQKQNENPLHQSDIVKFVKLNQALIEWHLKKVNTSLSTLDEHMMESIRQLGYTSDNSKEAKSQIEKFNKRKLSVSGYKEDIDKLGADISKKSKENAILRQKIEELGKQIKNLQENYKSLEASEASLRNDLKKKVDTIPIQMFYQSRGDTMSKVTHELKTLLANKLQLGRSKIQFIDCQTEEDVNIEIPLFIVCINTSRLGTDVGSTLQKLKGCVSSKVSILIFHHKDIHALPSQSSDRVLTGPVFKEIGGIFDLAFLSDKGIYPCEMNDNTADKIVTVLKSKD